MWKSAVSVQRQRRSIVTVFVRDFDPDLMLTCARETPKRSATRRRSSSLALPATGADFTVAVQLPSSALVNEESLALGFTLIRRVCT